MENKELKEGNVQTENDTTKLYVVKNEIKHFKTGQNSVTDSYGYTWSEVVKSYLTTGYKAEDKQQEVFVLGKTYKVLKRDMVTTFYDEYGNTLFDVENQRLESEYEWLASKTEQKITQNVNVETEKLLQESDKAEEKNEQSEEEVKKEVLVDDSVVEESKEEKYIGVDGAISKLHEELKKAEPKEFAEPIIGYLVDRCRDSESLAADICQIHKTWKKCYEFIVKKARKKLSGKSGPVRSDVVFEWAEDYFRKDDKTEEEKKAKEVAGKKEVEKKKAEKECKEKKDTAKENKARADYDTERKSPTNNHKLSKEEIAAMDKKEAPKPKPQPKKNNKDMDGQMDLFSLMDM